MTEKRKFLRLHASIEVTYKKIKQHKRQKTIETRAENISGGGVCFVAKDDLRSGDLLDLEISIPGLADKIHAVSEVLWFKTTKEEDRGFREAGVRFRDISPQDLHQVLEYVHSVGIGS